MPQQPWTAVTNTRSLPILCASARLNVDRKGQNKGGGQQTISVFVPAVCMLIDAGEWDDSESGKESR